MLAIFIFGRNNRPSGSKYTQTHTYTLICLRYRSMKRRLRRERKKRQRTPKSCINRLHPYRSHYIPAAFILLGDLLAIGTQRTCPSNAFCHRHSKQLEVSFAHSHTAMIFLGKIPIELRRSILESSLHIDHAPRLN